MTDVGQSAPDVVDGVRDIHTQALSRGGHEAHKPPGAGGRYGVNLPARFGQHGFAGKYKLLGGQRRLRRDGVEHRRALLRHHESRAVDCTPAGCVGGPVRGGGLSGLPQRLNTRNHVCEAFDRRRGGVRYERAEGLGQGFPVRAYLRESVSEVLGCLTERRQGFVRRARRGGFELAQDHPERLGALTGLLLQADRAREFGIEPL